MTARQLELFPGGDPFADRCPPQRRSVVPVSLDDAALIAAILDARIAEAPRLAAGAAKRRLTAAVAAFERLCRKFIGISVDRTIPEQIAAMEALAMIGEHLRVKRSCTSSSRVSCRGLISSPRWLKPRN